MKTRMFCLIIVFMVAVGMMPATGICGNVYAAEDSNISYKYDQKTKTLSFYGDGVIAEAGNSGVYEWRQYSLTAEKVIINEGIAGVGDYAFQNFDKVTTVDFPEEMNYLGGYAFSSCDKLKEVHLPDGITYYGWGIFEDCVKLKTIYFGSSPKNEYVTYGQENMFKDCRKLENIHVPRSNSVFSVKDGVLFADTTLILYPQTKTDAHYDIPEGTTAIGYQAFYNHNYLETVTIPDTVTYMHDSFHLCYELTALTIPASVTTIVWNLAFSGCHSLQYVQNDSNISTEFDSTYHPDGMVYWVNRETGKYVDSIANGTVDFVVLGNHKYKSETIKVDGVTYRLLENTKTLTADEMNKGTARADVKAVKFGSEYKISSKVKHKGWYYNVTNPDVSPVSEITGKQISYTNTRLVKGDYDAVYVSWSKVNAMGPKVSYKVEYKKKNGKWTVFKDAAVKNNCTLKNLDDGAQYSIRVTPHITVNGQTYYGKAKTSQGIYTLKKVNKPNVVKSGSSKVKITWNNINGETGYEIYKSAKMKSGFKFAKRVVSSTAKSATLKVNANTKYYYKVRAYKNIKINGRSYKVYGPWSGIKGYKLK